MSEKDLNLEGNVDIEDLDSLGIDEESLENLNVDDALDNAMQLGIKDKDIPDTDSLNLDLSKQESKVVDENVFLESGDSFQVKKNVLRDEDGLSRYLRRFFISSVMILLGVLAIVAFYIFSIYIKEARNPSSDLNKQEYIDKFKDKYKQVRNLFGINNTYEPPKIGSVDEEAKVNEIINASDMDYVEKKDLLSNYVSDLVRNAEDKSMRAETIKQDIAKQGYLPEELENLLSEDQAIDTIQRSLNALEVIKFSTATRVFLYMNTALSTISEMIRVSGVNVETLRNLFEKLSSRGEKDISAYVYMCYLNPFEVNANCDAVGDLDLYYQIAQDSSINIGLFKNAMNAISQLLEKADTTLFSITFNGFNAADKNIKFNIEVYTNQEDEKALMSQGKKNPNIFILTNIINLLKQSSFIIGAEINTKEINVNTKTLTQGGISRPVNYSTMDFTVPIQKNTEREIFDYIDIDSIKKLLTDRGIKEESEKINEENLNFVDNDISENNQMEENLDLENETSEISQKEIDSEN